MDNLTHSLVGALIGQAGLKRKTGLAMPALVLGANLPDIDATCVLLGGMQHLALRRGLTHGPIACVLLPLMLAGALYGFDRWQAKRGKRPEGRAPVHFGWLYALSLIACLTHPALDWLNSYGIRLLEPFSDRWFYGDVLFIIDLWLWLGLGVATWLSLRRERRGGEWRKPARIAIAAALAYIGLNAVISQPGLRFDRPPRTHIESPVPIAFWKREQITGEGDGLWLVNGRRIGDVPIDRCDLAAARRQRADVEAFLFWSRAPVIDQREDGSLVLGDARYYDPMSNGRFSVALPKGTCEGSPANGL
jgi:inner membrane protein